MRNTCSNLGIRWPHQHRETRESRRLYFSSFAYVLMHGLRRLGLEGTQHSKGSAPPSG
jgi:hypothetical protein